MDAIAKEERWDEVCEPHLHRPSASTHARLMKNIPKFPLRGGNLTQLAGGRRLAVPRDILREVTLHTLMS